MNSIVGETGKEVGKRVVQKAVAKTQQAWEDAKAKNTRFVDEAKEKAAESFDDVKTAAQQTLDQAVDTGQQAMGWARRNPLLMAGIILAAGALIAASIALSRRKGEQEPEEMAEGDLAAS